MNTHTALLIALLVAFNFWAPTSYAIVLDGAEYVVMKDKDGDEERLMGKSAGLIEDKMVDIIFEIPVKFSKKKFRCDSAKETPWRLERRVESQLELQGIIDALRKRPKPRALTEAQKKMLARVPICEPYILQLKVISRLLSGYDLARVQRPEEKSDDPSNESAD